MTYAGEFQAVLEELNRNGRFRELPEVAPLPGGRALCGGRELVNLSGNDYMGIAGNGELRRRFYSAYRETPDTPELTLSGASSRLLTGNTPAYARLEEEISEWYGGRKALVFSSGYHANTGILPALAGRGDLILGDKLNHASLIDGMRLSGAEFLRYRHLDSGHLEELLASRREKFGKAFIVTESLFSMDGDEADLKTLVRLKERYGCFLIVDEAHAAGVRGPEGRGLAAESGTADQIDILVGTFGKALGSAGAYAVTDEVTRELLVNRMRPFIFTTALPPVILNWSAFTIGVVRRMDSEREKLRRMGVRLRELCRRSAPERTVPGVSQIVPWIIGDDRSAVEAAARWREAGFLVFPIRPPTVPPGSARLRISLSAAHGEEAVEELGRLLG